MARQLTQQPMFMTSAVALAAAVTLLAIAPNESQQWAMGAAALLLAGLNLLLTVVNTSGLRSPEWTVSVMGSLSLAAGMAWTFAGMTTGPIMPAQRDGAVLIVLGGALIITNAVRRDPRNWLVCFAVSGATVTFGVLLASDSITAENANWAVASLSAIAGLTMIAIGATHWLSSADLRRPSQRELALSVAGAGFMGLSLSLVIPSANENGWWLPIIAGGLLASSLTGETARSPEHQGHLIPTILSLPASSSLLLLAVVGAGVVFWQSSDLDDGAAHGVLTVALSTAFVAVVALIFIGAERNRAFDSVESIARQLLRQSRTDPLTGLPNRRALDERLQSEIQRAARFNHPLSVGILDIDDFKVINDRFGHQTGDGVLRQIAASLEQELRTIDVAGRFGGEEFLIILPETDLEGAWIAADRLLRTIRAIPPVDTSRTQSLTASIGLASFPNDGRSAHELIRAADTALYAAKRAGKNQIGVNSPD